MHTEHKNAAAIRAIGNKKVFMCTMQIVDRKPVQQLIVITTKALTDINYYDSKFKSRTSVFFIIIMQNNQDVWINAVFATSIDDCS